MIRFISLLAAVVVMAGCSRSSALESVAGGDPARGEELAVRYGCATCHEIPRMPTIGQVGPPLATVAQRTFLAGRLPNTPANMMHWIRFPREVDPETLMPNLGVSEREAADLTAFLYDLL
jgi:cytochrome c2